MQVIKSFIEKHQIEVKNIAIGVSGGADSLALALMFKEEYPHLKIIALTVDHQLRPSSRKEAEYVAQIMKQHGIEHHILTWKGAKPSNGIEEAARIARYNLLCDWCHKHQIAYLAVAHHLYDQAETFLMRLERGSGLFGLSAMQDVSERDNVKILRPLLHISPFELKTYLKKRCIEWVEDESNQCLDYLRVRMRMFLPDLEQKTGITPERLVKAADNLQNVRAFIEDMVQKTICNHVHRWSGCGYSFDYTEFMNWHEELKFYVFSQLIRNISENAYIPEAEALKGLLIELQKNDFCGATLGGIYFCKQDLRIWLIKEYRGIYTEITEKEWFQYEQQEPETRGIKIPSKLKQALVFEKKHKK